MSLILALTKGSTQTAMDKYLPQPKGTTTGHEQLGGVDHNPGFGGHLWPPLLFSRWSTSQAAGWGASGFGHFSGGV